MCLPDCLEDTPQGEGPSAAHNSEDRDHFELLRQRLVQPEDRENQDPCDDRNGLSFEAQQECSMS